MLRILLGLAFIAIGVGIFTGLPIEQFIIPVLIIALGVRLLMGRDARESHPRDAAPSFREDTLDRVGIFSPMDMNIRSDDFKGGKMVLIFSGGTIDLRGARTSRKRLDIEIVAIFGGAKILVPAEWRVSSEGVGILGGYENKAAEGSSDTTLHIKGVAILGGVEIAN
jgi:hypothetical protein